jgi:hypothetical protein
MIQSWLMDHPILGWGLAHPLWALGVAAALLFISGGLLKAIAQLTEQLWMDLLRLPMRVLQWGLAQVLPWRKLHHTTISNSTLIDFREQTLNQERHDSLNPDDPQLCEIMTRLETIQHEQTLLLQDIKALILKDRALAARKNQVVLNEPSSKR